MLQPTWFCSCQRALCMPLSPRYIRNHPPKGPTKAQVLHILFACKQPKTKTGHGLGLCGSQTDPKGTQPTQAPTILWFLALRIAQMDA